MTSNSMALLSSSSLSSTSYVCDPIPAAKLASSSSEPSVFSHDQEIDSDPDLPMILRPAAVSAHSPNNDNDNDSPATLSGSQSPAQVPTRKLCVRHQRMADEGTNMKLQQSLDALPLEEREAVNAVWSNFSSSSHPRRALILQGLLTMCCFSQLSLLTEQLAHLIRIDPFAVLPREVSIKILTYLDATSLCRAAQVTKRWKILADDDVLWRGICEQHIGQKCHKCGWGLPVLDKKRSYQPASLSPSPSPALPPRSPGPSFKRALDGSDQCSAKPIKRHRSEQSTSRPSDNAHSSPTSALLRPPDSESPYNTLLAPNPSQRSSLSVTRPWKDVYSERMTIERNWRRGRCTVRTFKGHTDGVMCLQFSETLSHPAFPVLITGSYDRTVRVWNLDTGAEIHILRGHTRAVRALQFDDAKLITGSMDNTIKVWDWRRGVCIRTLTGHADGIVCLNFDSNVLASGSVDSTIKVWNLRTGGAFTLRGHSDWVNAVQLWDSTPSAGPLSPDLSLLDVPPLASPGCAAPRIDPGKMLFSASDDGTIRLWDLTLRTCVQQFTGHVGQVQSMKLLLAGECEDDAVDPGLDDAHAESDVESPALVGTPKPDSAPGEIMLRKKPILISGSLDNTIKLWDIETGKTVRTFFGHIEGVWAVASDKLRLVSGSHDRTIKVWSREEGRCTATLVGHQAAVSCLALGEDKIVSGSDDWDVKVWSFSE